MIRVICALNNPRPRPPATALPLIDKVPAARESAGSRCGKRTHTEMFQTCFAGQLREGTDRKNGRLAKFINTMPASASANYPDSPESSESPDNRLVTHQSNTQYSRRPDTDVPANRPKHKVSAQAVSEVQRKPRREPSGRPPASTSEPAAKKAGTEIHASSFFGRTRHDEKSRTPGKSSIPSEANRTARNS